MAACWRHIFVFIKTNMNIVKKALCQTAKWAYYGTTDQKRIDAGRFRLSQARAAHEQYRALELPARLAANDPRRPAANVLAWEQKDMAGLSTKDRTFAQIFDRKIF